MRYSSRKFTNYSLNDKEDIEDAVEMFTNYNLSALAVVDSR